MTEPTTPTGPSGVRQRDGRVEPFDADRICAVLFTVLEGMGRPDAFLARELTDGVVHFLAQDHDGATLTVEDLREQVIKFVRELRHPHLARAYELHTAPRPETPPTFTAEPPLFSREIVAAHEVGLLVLGDLAPTTLAARVLPWPRSAAELLPDLARLRATVSDPLVLDGPEFWLAQVGMSPEAFVTGPLAGFPAVLNLNIATPPPVIGSIATGPLFGTSPTPPHPGDIGLRLVELTVRTSSVRVAWHLRPGGTLDRRATEVVRHAVAGVPVEFVFDRSRRGIHLAEGVDRETPDLLLRVGVRLARMLGDPLQEPDAGPLLSRVGSLARLALTAGIQKRAHLRRQGILADGFTLDRARLQVIPLGLEALVEGRSGRGLVHGGTALDLGRRIVQHLRDVLRTDARKVQLATCLDEPPPGMLDADSPVLGVRNHDEPMPRRIRAATLLQEVSERGVLPILVPADPTVAVPRVLGMLADIGTASQIDRVRLVFPEGGS
jgi:hypothetical protein